MTNLGLGFGAGRGGAGELGSRAREIGFGERRMRVGKNKSRRRNGRSEILMCFASANLPGKR